MCVGEVGGWLAEESAGLREKTAQVTGGPGPDAAEPVTEWRFADETVSRVCDGSPTILLARFLALASCRTLTGTCFWPVSCLAGSHNVFQSEFGVGGGCGVPHSDGGGEDTQWWLFEVGANF